MADINQWEDITISVNKDFTQTDNTAKVKILVSLDKTKTKAYVTLKMINKDSWKLYDLEYQTISILDIEKVGYDSKIKRQGIELLVKKMLSRS